MNEKEVVEKAMTANMVDVTVSLYEPFYNFMKEYLAFFGDKKTVEELCRTMIYESVKFLQQELESFASQRQNLIEKGSWFNKWPHLAIVSTPDPEDEEDC